MKFCMEVIFGEIHLKSNTWVVRPILIPPQPQTPPTQKPPQITNFGNLGSIWIKLGEEVQFSVTNSIFAYGMAGSMLSHPNHPPQPP